MKIFYFLSCVRVPEKKFLSAKILDLILASHLEEECSILQFTWSSFIFKKRNPISVQCSKLLHNYIFERQIERQAGWDVEYMMMRKIVSCLFYKKRGILNTATQSDSVRTETRNSDGDKLVCKFPAKLKYMYVLCKWTGLPHLFTFPQMTFFQLLYPSIFNNNFSTNWNCSFFRNNFLRILIFNTHLIIT